MRTWDLFCLSFISSLYSSVVDHSATAPLLQMVMLMKEDASFLVYLVQGSSLMAGLNS